jgi:adenine-specific DNA methylase
MLALREKQIQQNYRPIIGVHKWFARRPGTVFRNLLLAEFNGDEPLESSYWRAHGFQGVIADPFMGGGTPIFEANRLGLNVVGTDVNPMAYWVVRQSLASLDLGAFAAIASTVTEDVERQIGDLYATRCLGCDGTATVKYFQWVKCEPCPICDTDNDLFPGYLLAEATRHPRHVVACSRCGALNECDHQPTKADPETCRECGTPVHVEGPARRSRIQCRHCRTVYPYPAKAPSRPPRHRMWALEYHCATCKPTHVGRFFKRPDGDDLARYAGASDWFAALAPGLSIPDDPIPAGDETNRLLRWGYRRFREMFNDRQLLGLGLLLRRIRNVPETEIRHALLTVFSDFLRYQNMLCRYDTYALKCQDIFSVHGFPVGLVQCENNLLGISRVGSGSFRHFVEKYRRAKEYCAAPFETRQLGRRKELVPVVGERIAAKLVDVFPDAGERQARLLASPAVDMPLPTASLDGVFTDPPYFDNVQYAELMDFCFAWLRLGLADEVDAFRATTTRTPEELTGNVTLGRGLDGFTQGLSDVFVHYAAALKHGAPFVFTYHHNDPAAYVPLVVAILDAGLDCTATLPVPAEMGASLHIARTGSSVVDSVFVCRTGISGTNDGDVAQSLRRDASALAAGTVRVSEGDLRCLLAGHVARIAVNRLRSTWSTTRPLAGRMTEVQELVAQMTRELPSATLVAAVLRELSSDVRSEEELATAL